MTKTLAQRNINAATNTASNLNMHTEFLDRAIARVWTDPTHSEDTRTYLDELSGISGDDLARLTRGPK